MFVCLLSLKWGKWQNPDKNCKLVTLTSCARYAFRIINGNVWDPKQASTQASQTVVSLWFIPIIFCNCTIYFTVSSEFFKTIKTINCYGTSTSGPWTTPVDLVHGLLCGPGPWQPPTQMFLGVCHAFLPHERLLTWAEKNVDQSQQTSRSGKCSLVLEKFRAWLYGSRKDQKGRMKGENLTVLEQTTQLTHKHSY